LLLEIDKRIKHAEKLLLDKFYEAVSKEEKNMIFAVMSKDVGTHGDWGGHWYQCPNGHIYTIGECGGAMQQTRCPECNEVVGGQSHTLAAGNAVASDFLRDVGAAQPRNLHH